MSLQQRLANLVLNDELRSIMGKMPKTLGTEGYDPWGYHPPTMQVALGMAKWLYDHYFRVNAQGLENIPKNGRLFVIANHSGQVYPMDAMMIGVAMATNPNGPRAPRAMIERILPQLPFIGNLFNRFGAALGDPTNCYKMLEREEAIIVFPEGERGFVKNWDQRYKLQRMGTGFVRIAMETNTPILPVGVVGCEEMGPSFGRIEESAHKLGFPVLPIASPLPLPVRIHLNFGKPLDFGNNVDDIEDVLKDNLKVVQRSIESLIKKGLDERQGVWR